MPEKFTGKVVPPIPPCFPIHPHTENIQAYPLFTGPTLVPKTVILLFLNYLNIAGGKYRPPAAIFEFFHFNSISPPSPEAILA